MTTTRRDLLKAAGLGAAGLMLPGGVVGTAAAASSPRALPYRVGRWLPSDQAVLDRWLARTIGEAERANRPLQPVMRELRELIESDPVLYMNFCRMFEQLPDTPKFERTPIGTPQVRSYGQMITLINHVLTTAPVFNRTGLVGFPINAIIDWPMCTPAGIDAFLDARVNAQFKRILEQWGAYLQTPASAYVLNRNPRSGWFGQDAMAAMPGFADDFVCDPAAPHHGFASWNDFFVRTFRAGRRPVAAPQDDGVIVSACESAPYRIEENVRALDTFWLKGQPYSLRHMFADDPAYRQFVGGTIYQAFLSALSYHRWHAPVNGTIVSTRLIDGSYYAQSPVAGWDPASPNESQGFITEVAARAIVVIDADDPRIGRMAFVSVGMAEVSTNHVTVTPGQHVRKGDELGMFRFGGSTHCLVFRPGVRLRWDLHGQTPGLESSNIHVNARLATVR
jgi:phosphatidylserine decarboxylase